MASFLRRHNASYLMQPIQGTVIFCIAPRPGAASREHARCLGGIDPAFRRAIVYNPVRVKDHFPSVKGASLCKDFLYTDGHGGRSGRGGHRQHRKKRSLHSCHNATFLKLRVVRVSRDCRNDGVRRLTVLRYRLIYGTLHRDFQDKIIDISIFDMQNIQTNPAQTAPSNVPGQIGKRIYADG